MCGALACSIATAYSFHYLKNCLTAESLDETYKKRLHREQLYIKNKQKQRRKIKSLTRMCNSIVVYVRVWPGPKLGFGWPGPARRECRRHCGERRGPRQGGRQTLSLVFERTKLSVQLLKLSVLLSLKGNHLFDVPTEKEIGYALWERNKHKQR